MRANQQRGSYWQREQDIKSSLGKIEKRDELNMRLQDRSMFGRYYGIGREEPIEGLRLARPIKQPPIDERKAQRNQQRNQRDKIAKWLKDCATAAEHNRRAERSMLVKARRKEKKEAALLKLAA